MTFFAYFVGVLVFAVGAFLGVADPVPAAVGSLAAFVGMILEAVNGARGGR